LGLLSNALALVGLEGSTQFPSKHSEIEIYLIERHSTYAACGAIEGVPEQYQAMADIGRELLSGHCVAERAIKLRGLQMRLAHPIYVVSMSLGLFIVAPACLIVGQGLVNRRRYLLLSLPFIAYFAAYTVLGFGADRYGSLLFPYALCVLIVAAIGFRRKLRSFT